MTSAVRAITAVLALAASGGFAAAQTAATFTAESNGQIIFATPSKNIGCTYTPAGGTSVYKPQDGGPEISCDRVKPSYVRVSMSPKNIRRYANVGDRDCCGESNVFAYGTKWTQGPFTCESAQSGLTCRRSDGKGFMVSQNAIKTLP